MLGPVEAAGVGVWEPPASSGCKDGLSSIQQGHGKEGVGESTEAVLGLMLGQDHTLVPGPRRWQSEAAPRHLPCCCRELREEGGNYPEVDSFVV